MRQFFLHSVTQPYTTWPRWRERGGGLCSLPLLSIAVVLVPAHQATYAGGIDSLESESILALLKSLKILALENYDCQLRHTFTDS